MIKKTDTQGFTLIELLVVIAIIGILASVVLGSLNTARNKGADAAIKSNLANMRAQAEIVYDASGSYGTAAAAGATVCDSFLDATARAAVAAAVTASGGTAATDRRCAVGPSGGSWAASVPTKQNTARSICVDSAGNSREIAGASPAIGGGTAAAVCPTS